MSHLTHSYLFSADAIHIDAFQKPVKKSGKPQSGGKGKKKKLIVKYVLDCTHPVEDGIMDVNSFVSKYAENVWKHKDWNI